MLQNVCKTSREQDDVNWQNRDYGRFLCDCFILNVVLIISPFSITENVCSKYYFWENLYENVKLLNAMPL